MCYASQQVLRKDFDYNAYIQGRLRGEYVVIYHTVVEEPVSALPEAVIVGEGRPESDKISVIIIPNTSLHSFKAPERVETAFTASFNFFQNRLAANLRGLKVLNTATCANCRGSPYRKYKIISSLPLSQG
jgi:hypothetical protein